MIYGVCVCVCVDAGRILPDSILIHRVVVLGPAIHTMPVSYPVVLQVYYFSLVAILLIF